MRRPPTAPLRSGVQAHRRGAFPLDLVPELAELGVFGANLGDYGCAGMSNVGYGLVMQARCLHAWPCARTVLRPPDRPR